MLVSEGGFREDGRKQKEFRRIEVTKSVFGDSGRVDLRQGNTQVSVECGNSKEGKKLNIVVEFLCVSRQETVTEKKVQEYESILVDIFNRVVLVDSGLGLRVVVREEGGSLLSAMVNCITLFLSYFGFSMIDLCYSCTASEDCIDLSSTEDGIQHLVLTIVYLINSEEVVYLALHGATSFSKFKTHIKDAIDACSFLNVHFKSVFHE
ncbi:ribonuclease [Ordospora colligata]|uniref:Ribonuclease n=1 Tax=Ordospora colligata OC4 TaxID=1354746 RepID=A0A0B2UIH3_9MICR|nr:ribonuclease [Ordospora colligata OC4]KHN69044.1 ribonuclease [Ordospora colligata OC4]TBU14325.1 ribonuclease [Ordospora colligata]TBU14390.1 ribonuclease [Ordospora colligata]TBU17951.1 ribonuclease [Ordospora colligata]